MRSRPRRKQLAAPRFNSRAIIDGARRLMARYEGIVGRDYVLHHGLHFDDFYEKLIYPEFRVDLYEDEDLGDDANGVKLLGRYDVKRNTAHLDRIISREADDPRRTFTCWHEVAGHGVLQGNWLRDQLGREGSSEFVEVTEYSISPATERTLEWQANLFAAHLAAPDWLVNYAMHTTFKPKRPFPFFEPGIYWLDVHGLRLRKYIVDAGDLCGWIGSKISGFFGGLSAEAVGYRVMDLGWVRDFAQRDFHLHRTAKRWQAPPVGAAIS